MEQSKVFAQVLDCQGNLIPLSSASLLCNPEEFDHLFIEEAAKKIVNGTHVADVLNRVIRAIMLPTAEVVAILNDAGYTDVSNVEECKIALLEMYTKQANQGETNE
jgi:hypothetical protein